MSVRCYGCFQDYSENEVTFVGTLSNGRKLELCKNCLTIYRESPPDYKKPDTAVSYVMNYRRLHDNM